MRAAAKVDGNQARIVEILRKAGAFVQPLHYVGKGCPDLLVAYSGRWLLLEVKVDNGRLTADQVKWHSLAATSGAKVHVVRSAFDALAALEEVGQCKANA